MASGGLLRPPGGLALPPGGLPSAGWPGRPDPWCFDGAPPNLPAPAPERALDSHWLCFDAALAVIEVSSDLSQAGSVRGKEEVAGFS